MADPYATEAPDLSARPTGPPPWATAVGERGGEFVGGRDGTAVGERGGPAREPASAVRFHVVACRGLGALAPFARVEPALAVLLWLEHTEGERSAVVASRLLAELGETDLPLFAIKQGCVAGPAERPGCFVISAELILTVLDAALAGAIGWERDPDFGYELPATGAGVEGEAARALLPRLLYADHDRTYEHAGLVVAGKRRRAEIATAIPGLDPAIGAAAGWPSAPTGDEWRE